MIATHAPKMYNARSKQSAIMARILREVPHYLVCSQTAKIRKEFWAAPKNAAHIKIHRETADKFVEADFKESLPDIEDPSQVKQLLVPLDWRNDEYVCVTPVTSMGFSYELFKRLHESNLPYRRWVIQPNGSALANHGEALLKMFGTTRLLMRGARNQERSEWTGDFVKLEARFEKMNISSGMVSVGFPAITAIGGLVHAIERKTNADIDFAVGFRRVEWEAGVSKTTAYKASGRMYHGRINGKITIKPSPSYSTEEIVAKGKVVLLLRSDYDLDEIANALKSIQRIAGGHLFDTSISVEIDANAPEYTYLSDASSHMIDTGDSMDSALMLYGEHGHWENGKYNYTKGEGVYTLTHSGYAFLEQPKERKNSRKNYPHAWCESVFSCIKLSSASDDVFWSRDVSDGLVYWRSSLS